MARPRLPIGIQSFVNMRTEGYAYVDKTPYLSKLLEHGKVFFLSRPRRFGKSLFIDTLDCAFSGRRELFEGLYLEHHWDWSRKYPVLRLDWSAWGARGRAMVARAIEEQVRSWEDKFAFVATSKMIDRRMLDLVAHIHQTTGEKVVVLIDEYDKPITDALPHDGDDFSEALAVRDILRSFYGVFKPLDEHLHFLMLTGVTKWAKAGIFSGLNQLRDITLSESFSALCGYTEGDLDAAFGDWLIDRDRARIRAWYNGYSWGGEAVYNPFDILLHLSENTFRSFWFETGTPSSLVKLWQQRPIDLAQLDGLEVGEEILGSYDLANLSIETLLFQAGYLTIKSVTADLEGSPRYKLGLPNREVRTALSRFLLANTLSDQRESNDKSNHLSRALQAGDAERVREIVASFFESIPHYWAHDTLTRYQGYFASVFYAYFAAIGADVIPEDMTIRGRMDLTVKLPNRIWIFEFKVRRDDKPVTSPLAQIKDKKYADKYASDGKPIVLIGIVFDGTSKEIETWEVSEA